MKEGEGSDMRKLLNTLYVTSTDAHLAKDGQNVVVWIADKVRLRVPIHNLEGIVTMGYTGASPALMGLCAERGVSLAFHTPNGRLLSRVMPANKGNVLLRKRQYSMHDNVLESLQVARYVVIGKLANSRSVLRRFVRDYRNDPRSLDITPMADRLTRLIEKASTVSSVDELRGIEGDGARSYYSVFSRLIRNADRGFSFSGRSRRPPLDRTNAILSFLYSMLANDCTAALETVGLDSQVGFLHRLRPGRASLALDIMEELRPYLVDRLALTIINNRQIKKGDFQEKENGAVLLEDRARKVVIDAWQSRKQQTVVHPFLNEKIEVGLIPYVQSLLLARFIRGDLEAYPPFLMG